MVLPSLKKFLSYLQTFGRFFGDSVLTVFKFITVYLNYDTDHNPFRQAILKHSAKSKEQMNLDCLKYVKLHTEEPMDDCFLNKKKFLGKDVVVSKRLNEILGSLLADSNANSLSEAATIHDFMFEFFFYEDDNFEQEMKDYFKKVFDVDFDTIWEDVNNNTDMIYQEEKTFHLPEFLIPYATIIDGKREEYKLSTREQVKDLIWNMFRKANANNLVIVGEEYVNPDYLIYNMAYEVEHDVSCPERSDTTFIEINLEEMAYQEAYETKILKVLKKMNRDLLDLKDRDNVIVYLKNFASLVDLSGKSDGKFLTMLMPLFWDKHLRVAVVLQENEAKALSEWTINAYGTYSFIEIGTPRRDEIDPYISGTILKLSMVHGVNIDKKFVDLGIQFAKAMSHGEIIGSINIIDFAAAFANSKGRVELETNDFVEYFKIEFNEFEKSSIEYRKLIAYHEAGHFVLSRFCEHYKAVYSDLVSIISAMNYGGANILEYDATMVKDYGYDFYLECIAMNVAGRKSEELFLGSVSSGAEADLEYSTQLATAMVATLGLDKANKFAIKGNENLRSERSMNEVADKVNDIMEEADALATNVLTERARYVETLAEILLKRKIISRKAILELEVENEGEIYLKVE